MQLQQKSGQSLVEYVVLLALVTVVAVSIVAGIGHRSTNRYAQVSDALAESTVAAATDGKGKPGVAGIAAGKARRP
ncbi:MAG: hypothetical protein PCFJNLEI_02627 [Verrucomicrobiae bacterium]|nr:hypothetical protein [Verrucomicrobiae bacterium]